MKEDLVSIEVQGKDGIMTCIGVKKVDNKDIIYGVSAAHVLLSGDRKPDLRDKVNIFYSKANPIWSKAGILDQAIFMNGLGEHPNWGILDAGCFLFSKKYQKFLKSRIVPLRKSAKLAQPKTLKGTYVYGYSVKTGKNLKGKIENVFVNLNNQPLKFDLAIEFESGVTEKGDSGMLWKSQNGSAIGMHIYGNSNYSYATLITRVKQALNMSFYKVNI